MSAQVSPGSPEANDLAEQHRSLLSKYFPASHSKHVLIARGYTEDERFRAHYENRAEGLVRWLRDIIDTNAEHHGVDVENAQWL